MQSSGSFWCCLNNNLIYSLFWATVTQYHLSQKLYSDVLETADTTLFSQKNNFQSNTQGNYAVSKLQLLATSFCFMLFFLVIFWCSKQIEFILKNKLQTGSFLSCPHSICFIFQHVFQYVSLELPLRKEVFASCHHRVVSEL